MSLEEKIWPVPLELDMGEGFAQPSMVTFSGDFSSAWIEDFCAINSIEVGESGYLIDFKIDDALPRESYNFVISTQNCKIYGGSRAGLFYGWQTFLQIVCFGHGRWHECRVSDAPAVQKRSFMADMGRSLAIANA